MATAKQEVPKAEVIAIKPPKFRTIAVKITGTAPYMQQRFWKKEAIRVAQEAGQTARGKKVRVARDFDNDFVEAQHMSSDGWNGIPASALRSAAIDVCRVAGFKMTFAKMSIFIVADGFDKNDGTPLVKIIADKPEKNLMAVRNATGVADIRSRPMWREWSAVVRVRFDEDQFTLEGVVNLIKRAGMQIGIGEGRPYSKSSNGMDFGTFDVVEVQNVR